MICQAAFALRSPTLLLTQRTSIQQASGCLHEEFMPLDRVSSAAVAAQPLSLQIDPPVSTAPRRGLLDRLRGLGRDPRIRFLIAGGGATGLNWVVRFPLNVVLPYWAAVTIAACIHMACAFVLYRKWVFPGSERPVSVQIRDFILINLIGMAVTVAVSVVLRHLMVACGMAELFAAAGAHIVGIGCGAVAGYLGHRYVTFR
jgi:energy-coupling factor transport system substrate-specific component